MKYYVDFSELSEFATELNNLKGFDTYAKRMVSEIGKVLVDYIKDFPPVETTTLINGWDKRKVAVTKTTNGYMIRLVNDVPYALAVNDGHKAYNQYGGPYPIKNRVKVQTPYEWQQGDKTWYVFGHFFVERGKAALLNTNEINKIIYDNLKQWWSTI